MSDVTAQLVDAKQRERLLRRFGSRADDWLAGLPDLVDDLAAEWKLTVLGPAPHGRTSVVVHCRRIDGSAGILKISPDPRLGSSEARILRIWEPTGRVPAVWEVDAERGAVLLEAIGTGRTVALNGVVPPMETIGALISDLHSADVPRDELGELHPLISRINFVFDMWDRYRQEGAAADVVSAALVHHGHARARALAHGEDDIVPLHGDLHPGNVLDGGHERGLVAVDPRACVGDAAADAIDWPLWKAASLEEVERRIAVLAPVIGVPSDRLLAWCRACAPIFAVALANRGRADTDEFRMLLDLCAC
ncbi:aminoglycoside resistance protein [Nocardiopsis gilva YIM 90087]|uniref:Aminoglycoside resistance protein n=1 Tax=Nocardiopsis gilva YIM 90087 TaxID=1235441 RepID=A0A223SB15_9ACTN|nr:aminoglycoside phosphotransferase family protein [Nocardiopsis gilva]ASU85361.1 aminoglycoside resistance protein [Nocardiopsis gilva YIM 90087]